MTIQEKEELFIKFMKKHKAWKEWCREMRIINLDVNIALLELIIDPINILNNMKMFDYTNRPDRGFWNNLNFKWKECLHEQQ